MILYSIVSKPLSKQKFPLFLAAALTSGLLMHLSKNFGWILKKDHKGQPFAVNPRSGDTGFVSISHSGCLLAIAVSLTAPVGIDIEYHRRRNFQELAAFAYGEQEQAMVSREGCNAFYKIWTAREALTKATGAELYDLMDGRDILKPGSGSIQLQGLDYIVGTKMMMSGYSLTLISKNVDKIAPTLREAPLHVCTRAIDDFRAEHGMNFPEAIIPVRVGPLDQNEN